MKMWLLFKYLFSAYKTEMEWCSKLGRKHKIPYTNNCKLNKRSIELLISANKKLFMTVPGWVDASAD